MFGPAVEFSRRQGVQHRHQAMGGIIGELRVGGMPLHPMHGQPPGQAAAAADLDHVAEDTGRCRLADKTGVEPLAARRQPFEHFLGAVDPGGFLVACDQEADRAVRARLASGKPMLGGSDESGDRALHVDRTTPPQRAVAQAGAKRVERPRRVRAGRHHVGMPGKTQIGPALAAAGVEVDDRVAAVVAAKHQAMTGEAEILEMRGDDVDGALVLGGDARPADQLGGECGRIECRVPHSRKRSLIAVLARVCSSTVLTMTAQ